MNVINIKLSPRKTLQKPTTNNAESDKGSNKLDAMHLFRLAEQDYVSARILWFTAGVTVMDRVMLLVADCLEKTMKFFLQFEHDYTLEKTEELSHNLENIRLECFSQHNFYENTELKEFCRKYSGASGHEILGYGSNSRVQVKEMSLGGGEDAIAFLDRTFWGMINTFKNSDFVVMMLRFPQVFETDLLKACFYNPGLFKEGITFKNQCIQDLLEKRKKILLPKK